MSTPFLTAVGAPPVCTSLKFRSWLYDYYRYRLNECPLTRPNGTIYVANDGNDANPGTSIGSPVATISRANELIDAFSSDAQKVVSFACNDIWQDRDTIVVEKNNITITSHGTGRRPYFNWFYLTSYANWSVTGGRTNVYEHGSIGTAVAAVRLQRDKSGRKVWGKAFSLDQCEDHPYSFYWDSGASKLYINCPATDEPPTSAYVRMEYALNSQMNGIAALGDGIRINGLHFAGAGATSGGTNLGKYGIWWEPVTNTDACVISNCESYYDESHNIGAAYDLDGGFLTVTGCRAGGMTGTGHPSSPINGTLYVHYANNGDQESLFWNNETAFGDIPNFNLTYGLRYTGAGIFGHCSAGPKFALAIAKGTRHQAGQFQVNGPSGFGAVKTWTDLKDARTFIIDEDFPARDATALDDAIPDAMSASYGSLVIVNSENQQQTVHINCKFDMKVPAYRVDALITPPAGAYNAGIQFQMFGHYINCVMRARFPAKQLTQSLLGNHSLCLYSGPSCDHQIWNCLIELVTERTVGFATLNSFQNTGDFLIANSIIALVCGQSDDNTRCSTGLENNAAKLVNNAYLFYSYIPHVDITGAWGHSNDPYKFEDEYRSIIGPPAPDSDLISANQQLILGYPLEYDINWEPRSPGATARGPWEFVRDPAPIQLTPADILAAFAADPTQTAARTASITSAAEVVKIPRGASAITAGASVRKTKQSATSTTLDETLGATP